MVPTVPQVASLTGHSVASSLAAHCPAHAARTRLPVLRAAPAQYELRSHSGSSRRRKAPAIPPNRATATGSGGGRTASAVSMYVMSSEIDSVARGKSENEKNQDKAMKRPK